MGSILDESTWNHQGQLPLFFWANLPTRTVVPESLLPIWTLPEETVNNRSAGGPKHDAVVSGTDGHDPVVPQFN